VGDIALIQSIGIMIVAAAIVVLLARRLNVPTIVLYILTGLALGPILGVTLVQTPDPSVGVDTPATAVDMITDIGIALLLFVVGLELSIAKVRDVGKVAVLAGLGQTLGVGLLAFVICLALGFSMIASAFIATALTNGSTVLIVKLLDQMRQTHRKFAHVTIGMNLVKDIVLIVVLAFLAGLGGVGENGEAGGGVVIAVFKTVLSIVVLGALVVLASRYLLGPIFEWAIRYSETVLIWGLTWCFLLVALAQWLGMSPGIGAFLAGLSLAQLHGADDLRHRVHPLMNFFLALFFISVGTQMKPAGAMEHWPALLVFVPFVLIVNPIICMVVVSWLGVGERTATRASVTMGQISELSFIFIAAGFLTGAIDQSTVSFVTLLGLVTISVSAYMVLYNDSIYMWLRKRGWLRIFRAKQIDDDRVEPQLHNHVIIIGMNGLGRELAKRLHEQGETVLALDNDAKKLEGLPCKTLLGNIEYHSVLEEAGLDRAKLGISALHIEETNLLFAYECKKRGVPAAIHAFDRSVFADLRRIRVDYLMDSKAQGSTALVTRLHERGVVQS